MLQIYVFKVETKIFRNMTWLNRKFLTLTQQRYPSLSTLLYLYKLKKQDNGG